MPGMRRIAVSLVFVIAGTTALGAQQRSDQVFLDAVYSSRAMWRGTPRVSRPVSQLSGTLALEVPGGHLSGTAWALVELHPPDAGDFSIGGDDRRIAEFDYSLQYAGRTTYFDLVGGLIRYQLENDSAMGTLYREFSTTELYASVALREGPLRNAGFTPAIRTWLDVNKVKGMYTELELMWAMPLLPLQRPLGAHLGVRSGFSAGQSTGEGEPGYFDQDGFTHVEALATITGRIGSSLGAGFTWHQSFGIDAAARRSSSLDPAPERGSWGWLDLWLTVRWPGRTR
jgi:hypothetical protein